MSIKILIADDDDVDREMIKRSLDIPDVSLLETNDGLEVIEIASANDIDCIILDYYFPKCEGIDCVQAIRKNGIYTPIVMITGLGNERLVVNLFQAGVNDYIPKKEITKELLTSTVLQVIDAYQKRTKQLSDISNQLDKTLEALNDFDL